MLKLMLLFFLSTISSPVKKGIWSYLGTQNLVFASTEFHQSMPPDKKQELFLENISAQKM